MKKYVAVRTKYYKSHKGKSLEWHVRRDNRNKNTASVFDEHTHNNVHHEIRSRGSCRAEYKELNGRKIRSDYNEIFEHVLIFSRDKFEQLEEKYKDKSPDFVKKAICKLVDEYGQEIKKKYGFEPLRYDLHMDEGRYDKETGEFKRNIHVHFSFYNYNFDAKKAHIQALQDFKDNPVAGSKPPEKPEFIPLNPVKKKVKDKNGKLAVNPAFADFQDIAGEIFKKAGFVRGQKKSITNAQHLDRDQFIFNKQKELYGKVKNGFDNLKQKYDDLKKDIPVWMDSIKTKIFVAKIKSRSIADNLDSIVDDMPEETAKIEAVVESIEAALEPSEPEKVTPKRQRRRRGTKPKK